MIAVLGSTGTIGKHVVRTLLDDGQRYVAPRRPEVDLGDTSSLEFALRGADQLLLITAHSPDQDLHERNALEAARAAGVSRIVKISGGAPSLSPNGPSSSSVAHWRSEQRIEQSGIDFCFLRCSFFMQNLLTLQPVAGFLAAPMGDGPIAMIDARDIARCAVAVLLDESRTSEAWHLTGPAGVTFRDAAKAQGLRYLNVPPAIARAGLKRRGATPFEIQHSLGMAHYFASGADGAATPSVETLTGESPRSLDQFLSDQGAAG